MYSYDNLDLFIYLSVFLFYTLVSFFTQHKVDKHQYHLFLKYQQLTDEFLPMLTCAQEISRLIF